MGDGDAQYSCRQIRVRLPLCTTLLTESSAERLRHPAIVLALSETGGRFISQQQVKPGEAIGVILDPDLRYAVRGRVTWARQMLNKNHVSFGVTFEDEIPASLWDILGRARAA